MLKNGLKQHQAAVLYLFFGVCTTAINMVAYDLCYNICKLDNVASVMAAWFLSVVFAFITNKLFVFESKSFKGNVLAKELGAFLGCRIATGVLDMIVMYLAVDLLGMNGMLWKFASNVIVVLINYIASKLFVFRPTSQV